MYRIMYLRKSRADRPDESVEEVLQRHEEMLQEYARRTYGSPIPEARIYREVVSGETIQDRPIMQRVLSVIEDIECTGVLVVDPQRLTRGDLTDCGTVVNAFRYSGTRVVTPMHEYDLANDMDRRFFQDELLRGNDYLEYTKLILSRGKYASAKKGYYIGSRIPFGYTQIWIDDHRPSLAIVEEEAYYVRMMYDMYLAGHGPAEIVKKLNSSGAKPRKSDYFSAEAVKHILANPTYIGKIRWNRTKRVKKLVDGKIVKKKIYSPGTLEVFDGKHPAIIDEDVFNAVQAKRGSIPRVRSGRRSTNPLAGLLRCKHCGKVMHYNIKGGRSYFKCDAHYYGHCPQNGIHGDEVIDQVYAALESNLKNVEVEIQTGHTHTDHSQAISNLKGKLEDLKKQKDGLYEFLEKRIYTPELFVERRDLLDGRIEAIDTQIKELEKDSNRTEDLKRKKVNLIQALEALKDPDVPTRVKNSFLKGVVDVIYIDSSRPQRRGKPSDFDLEIKLK